MSRIQLRGITWSHSRALPPLVAASQRFEELHPEVRIVWEARTLDEFGHAPLSVLAQTYDLLVIDHPMLGEAHREGFLVELQQHLSPQQLMELQSDALEPCLESYGYEGSLYALPIDAAAPAASYRPDLLEAFGEQVPSDWKQLLGLARRGLVQMPAFPADLFLNLMGMCVSKGSYVGNDETLFEANCATGCLQDLKKLASFMPATVYRMNPIAVYEAMSSGEDVAYCPFAYTYSNYSRPGFAKDILFFANPVALSGHTLLRTVLGGTGIAITAGCEHVRAALEFSRFVAGAPCQTFLYGMCGGQPASRPAWKRSLLNGVTNNFFERTAAAIESA